MNPYTILNVPEDSDQPTIKAAWRKLAKEFHPDTNSDENSVNKLAEINNAYDLIKTVDKRQKYDMSRNNHSYNNFSNSQSDFIFRNFADIFDRRPSKALNLNIDLTLDEINSGKHINNTIVIDGEDIKLDFNIPPGIPDNARFNITRHTNQQGIEILISATVTTVNTFDMQRVGNDILVIKKVSVWDAILGNEICIIGLDNKQYNLKIPPGTQPDSRLVLRSVGLPEFNSSIIGNIVVLIKIEIPTSLSEDQLAKIKEINQNCVI